MLSATSVKAKHLYSNSYFCFIQILMETNVGIAVMFSVIYLHQRCLLLSRVSTISLFKFFSFIFFFIFSCLKWKKKKKRSNSRENLKLFSKFRMNLLKHSLISVWNGAISQSFLFMSFCYNTLQKSRKLALMKQKVWLLPLIFWFLWTALGSRFGLWQECLFWQAAGSSKALNNYINKG